MKKLLTIVLIAILLPQVAFAAWWNPFSWFGGWSFKGVSEKAALEERVKELEERLNVAGSVQTATTSDKTVDDKKESSKNLLPEPTPTPVQKYIAPTTIQTQTPTVDTNVSLSIDELIKKYNSFRDSIAGEQGGLKKNSSLYTEKNYYSYLEDLLKRINGDLGYLWTVRNWKQIPNNIESLYMSKFNELQKEHQSKAATYGVERAENERNYARQAVVNYIETNKYELYIPSVHVEAAELLYLFDKSFGTNYAKEFDLKKTQQETVEFANRFLIDQ